MICPKEEFKSPSLDKEKNSWKLQNENYAHVRHTKKELKLIQGTPSLIPWCVSCIQITDEWNKWNEMEKEGIYFILC